MESEIIGDRDEGDDYSEDVGISALIVPIHEFVSMCDMAYITDDDGVGYYGWKDSESKNIINPTDVAQRRINENYTHVWWYSK
jgi:predicted nucleotide-binding protein (sugar kinase/HSP70/actin superfamily)